MYSNWDVADFEASSSDTVEIGPVVGPGKSTEWTADWHGAARMMIAPWSWT